MCWRIKVRNLQPHIADKDIEVYKVVKLANDKFCVACYQNYCYEVGADVCREVEILIRGHYAFVTVGLHSYKSFTFVPNSIYNGSWKDFYTSEHPNSKHQLLLNNDRYLATFIISRGTTYFENELGEIVSNHILYTGKYLKL